MHICIHIWVCFKIIKAKQSSTFSRGKTQPYLWNPLVCLYSAFSPSSQEQSQLWPFMVPFVWLHGFLAFSQIFNNELFPFTSFWSSNHVMNFYFFCHLFSSSYHLDDIYPGYQNASLPSYPCCISTACTWSKFGYFKFIRLFRVANNTSMVKAISYVFPEYLVTT